MQNLESREKPVPNGHQTSMGGKRAQPHRLWRSEGLTPVNFFSNTRKALAILYTHKTRQQAPKLIEIWVAQDSDRSTEFLSLISGAEKVVQMVVGGPRPEFFEDSRLIQLFEDKLVTGVTFELVLHQPAATLTDAENSLRLTVPRLLKLKKRFADRFRIFQAPDRPDNHLTIVDGRDAMNEANPHDAVASPRTLFVWNDEYWANRQERLFVEERERSTEILDGPR